MNEKWAFDHTYTLDEGDTLWRVCCPAFRVLAEHGDYCNPHLTGGPEETHLAGCHAALYDLPVKYCPYCGTPLKAKVYGKG